MSSNKFIARNGLAVGTTPVDIVDSTGTILVNAPTATKLQTARTISLSGDVAGSVSFDGSGNAAITTTIQPDSVALGTDTTGNYMINVAAGTGVSVSHTQGEGSTATVSIGQAVGTTDNVTFNNVTVNGTLTSDDITSTNISVAGNATITGNLTVSGTTTTVNSTTIALADLNLELARNATTAAQANGAGITVTGPTAPATLTYSSSDDRWNLNKNLNVTTVYGALSGNASTASAWQTARTETLSGDITGSATVDGSANWTISTTLANSGVTAGSYGSGTAIPVLTIDAKGRVTAASTSAVTIGNSGLTLSIGTAGATNTTVTIGTGTGFTANATSAYTYDIKVGPALTALATLMTTAGAGFIKRGATADTYTIDTNTYLTGNQTITISGDASGSGTTSIALTLANSGVTAGTYNNVTVNAKGLVTSGSNVSYLTSYTETDTLATVTGRGASTSTASTFSGGLTSSGGLTITGSTTLNTTTPGTGLYQLNFTGQSTVDYAQGITWGWSTNGAQAGIYVQSSGAYGTKMYLATTDSFATGAKTAVTIDHSGNVSLSRGSFSTPTTWINYSTGNYNGYNENIRLYPAGNNVSVIAFGATGISGTPWNSILGFSDRFEIRQGDQWQERSYANYMIAYGSYRAPIFYDSDNTAAYANLAQTSGTIIATGASSDTLGYNASYGIYIGGINGRYLYSGNSSYTGPVFHNGTSAYTVYHTGNVPAWLTSESDTLATVTGRGATTSTTVALNGGAGLGDGWLYFNDTQRDVGAATYYPNVQTRAVRFIFANASTANSGGNYAGVMQFNPWSGTTASTGDASYQLSFGSTATNGGGVPKLSIRKGIDTTWNSWYTVPLYGVNSYSSTLYGTVFYDADNTAYYCDPNSRSNLSTLNTGGATIASGMLNVYNGGAGGVGWGTGFNMGDSSNYTSWIQDGGVDRRRNYGTGGWDWYNSGASKSYWGDNSGNSYASASFRAPIFYDNDNTSYYTDPASTSQLNYAVVQNLIDSAGTRFTTPAGGSYTSTSGTVTGAFKIKLPTDRNNSSTMVQFGVTIYEYSTGQTHQFRISGYNYGGGNWYNWAATQLTDGGRGALTIRWGYDSTGDCVWIGETNTSWSYPQVFVTDVQTGYGGFSNNWGAGWSISLITTFDTVEQSRTASLVKTANNASNWGFADYGTIWYDTNNTGYYTDPASTSYVNWLQTAGSLRSNNHLYLDQNYGSSVIGAYNSYRYQGIYSMGDSYKLSLDGTTVGNLYGLAWSHPNAGGAAANLASHGWLLLENGSFKTACGGGRITTTADIRGTIYYDYDNTAYYCDPASTSVFNQINLNTGGTAKMLWRAAGSGTPGIGAPFYWNSATGSIVIEVSDNDTGGVVIDNEGVTVFGAGDTGGVFRVIDEDSYQSLLNVTNATCFQINQGAGGGGYIRGDFTATGNLIAQSDIRLKYDIEPINNALEKVLAIRGITFRMQGALNPSRNVGVIAQEVEAVLPEAVRENEEGIKSVAYGNMVGLLIEAIKEQQSEIDELKALVKQLLAK